MPNYIQKSINELLDIITQKKSCELVRICHKIKIYIYPMLHIISNQQVVRFMDRDTYL